jgi:hypothetical protein
MGGVREAPLRRLHHHIMSTSGDVRCCGEGVESAVLCCEGRLRGAGRLKKLISHENEVEAKAAMWGARACNRPL